MSANSNTGGLPDWAVILFLIFLGPIGLIIMWTSSRWRRDTKLAITGFLFPPLWAPLLWKLRLPPWMRLALIAALVAANTIWINYLAGFTPAVITLVVTVVLGIVWMTRSAPTEPQPDGAVEHPNLRRIIESKLDTCHDLISRIEDSPGLDLLPADAPARRKYMHALEMREEGMDLYRRAVSEPDLVAADSRLTRAMDSLRDSRDAIAIALEPPKTEC